MLVLVLLVASLLAALTALAQRRLASIALMAGLSHVPLLTLLFLESPLKGTTYLASVALATGAALYVSRRLETRLGTDELDELGGLYAGFPLTSWSFIGAALALTMFPPFPQFLAEHYIAGLVGTSVACVLLLAITRILLLGAMFYAVRRVFFGPPRVHGGESAADYAVPALLVFLSLTLGVIVMLRG